MAGHHASLLTETVAAMLPQFDVYITDWKNAREVRLNQGSFDMDDYIDYIIEFIKYLGPKSSVMAVCQPGVPVLAATCILACQKDENLPSSLILMGAPIDARQNPTGVNEFATQHDINWFNNYLVTTVPANYPGFMRKVYPGALQLTGFINLDLQRHIQSYINLFIDIVNNNAEEIDKHKKFYNRYLSVLDLPAEFYLQTIKEIFHNFCLAKGEMVSRGRNIDPSCINKTAILCIEGQNDRITGIGQTKAALDLCRNLPDSKKHYHLEPTVGHYGIFSGGKFRRNIAPVICNFIAAK
jgi:poly(3-hydroxybutyrate) depolymerase